MNLRQTFDPDISPDVARVLNVAALLDTTEFKVFSMSYRHWFGRSASEADIERFFTDYMFKEIVPLWVRQFTRQVEDKARRGRVDASDYGLTHPPATPRMIFLGKLYTAGLVLVFLVLLAFAWNDDLLLIARNCYFPPCY